MKKSFESKEEKMWDSVWDSFARNRETSNVGAIIKTFQKYETWYHFIIISSYLFNSKLKYI